MKKLIHPTCIIHPQCSLSKQATVGPFTTLGELVVVQDNVHVSSHVVVQGRTLLQQGTSVGSFSCIGSAPQLKKTSTISGTVIERDCVLREHVTVHAGTNQTTRVGANSWLLGSCHVGHDSQVGERVVISNGAQLAGHVLVGDDAVIGGLAGIQQFCVLGRGVMVGGGSMVDSHVPPFSLVAGNRAKFVGINLRGLRRRKVPNSLVFPLIAVSRRIFVKGANPMEQAKTLESQEQALLSRPDHVLAREFVEFIVQAGQVSSKWPARRAAAPIIRAC